MFPICSQTLSLVVPSPLNTWGLGDLASRSLQRVRFARVRAGCSASGGGGGGAHKKKKKKVPTDFSLLFSPNPDLPLS